MSIVPINIRPHLIPYFFKELEGQSKIYLNKSVTAVKISSASSLMQWVRLFMLRVDFPEKPSDFYNIYLTVEDTPRGKKYDGNFYRYESGRQSFLKLPEDVNTALNDLLEDIFRMGFITFIKGYMTRPNTRLNDGIDSFIDLYDLLEHGFTRESLRQLYYREKKKARLERFVERSSNRTGTFKP